MEHSYLKIEQKGAEEARFQIHGNPVVVTQMIGSAMKARQEIAAAMIASVVHYCHGEKIDCGELEHMVKFH